MAVSTGYSTSQAPAGRGVVSRATSEKEGKYWSLSKCKRAYMQYLGDKREEIDEQQNGRAYRHGAQWTTSQVEVFNKRKQPVVTYNRIGRKIDSINGLMEKLKQDPKAYPRNTKQTDENAAELATQVVRFVVEQRLRSQQFPFVMETAAVDGIGGVELILDEGEQGDHEINFAWVATEDFFYDPRSKKHTFEDARYMGQARWLHIEDIKDMFPDQADDIQEVTDSELTSNPDNEKKWFDSSDDTTKRMRLVDICYRHDGKWCYAVFTGAQILAEGPSPFYDEKGDSICKFIMFSAFVDHEGDRYGFVRNLRSAQDEINQRRSKGLHELNSRRIKAEDGAFADIEITRREAVRPDGVVIYNKGFEMEFDDQARIANVEGQLKFLEDAKNEIENFGPSPALIGQGLEYKSGRAINLLQQAGIAELGPFVVGVKNWKMRLYRAIWAAVQRYWTAERWIRVTDAEGLAQAIQLNGIGVDEFGIPRMVNAVGQLDVNFVMDEGPDEINMMADAYDTLVALTAQGANIPPAILLELAPLQSSVKRKLLALLEKPDPMAQQAKMIAVQGEAAKVEETKSKVALNMASAQEKAQGGAHNIMERQMDMQFKEREHQLKGQEMVMKIQGEREKTKAKVEGEFMKLQTQQAKSQQDLVMNEQKNQIALRQTEQKGELGMRQAEQKNQMGLRQSEEKHRQAMKQQKANGNAQKKKPR